MQSGKVDGDANGGDAAMTIPPLGTRTPPARLATLQRLINFGPRPEALSQEPVASDLDLALLLPGPTLRILGPIFALGGWDTLRVLHGSGSRLKGLCPGVWLCLGCGSCGLGFVRSGGWLSTLPEVCFFDARSPDSPIRKTGVSGMPD